MEILKLLSANEIVAQILSFLLLLAILRIFAWKRLLKLLDDRRESIALEFRKIEDAQSAATRLANARAELEAAKRYDYIVVNDDLDAAVGQIESIITAESLKTSRREFSGLP